MRERRLLQLKQTARASLVTSGLHRLPQKGYYTVHVACMVNAFSFPLTLIVGAQWLCVFWKLGLVS